MGRGYSYSPSPPRRYSRRLRSPSPRGRYRSHARDLPTSLLVRNLRHDCRPEDLRARFGEFGPLKDIYLPRDYYTGRRRSPLGYSRSPRYAGPYSRSPSYARTYSRGHDYYSPSPRGRHYSRCS
ncbi:serine/arginine-rich SC35-like splicing factor SCL33 [Forsythia ovata]|uniref:Serine/arginine-rich SC35-like splicing factor SCL33 n=1 Tax=Forsythia ovata TaxID=205694 RepID=A0ABD1PMG6_9LAMI